MRKKNFKKPKAKRKENNHEEANVWTNMSEIESDNKVVVKCSEIKDTWNITFQEKATETAINCLGIGEKMRFKQVK